MTLATSRLLLYPLIQLLGVVLPHLPGKIFRAVFSHLIILEALVRRSLFQSILVSFSQLQSVLVSFS